MKTFKLPDLGEGLSDADIQAWHVTEGQQVTVDQLLLTVETAKAIVELPSPYSGTITQCYGQPGDTIPINAPLVDIDDEPSEAPSEAPAQSASPPSSHTVVGTLALGEQILTESPTGIHPTHTPNKTKAMPAIRALAKTLGVSIDQLAANKPDGRVGLMYVQQALTRSQTHRRAQGHGPSHATRAAACGSCNAL